VVDDLPAPASVVGDGGDCRGWRGGGCWGRRGAGCRAFSTGGNSHPHPPVATPAVGTGEGDAASPAMGASARSADGRRGGWARSSRRRLRFLGGGIGIG
jgi:hypothetical protein